MSEIGPDENILPLLKVARKTIEKRLFFERFEDYVEAKLRVRKSQDRYGRENIVGVGIGLKNWPEGPQLNEEDYRKFPEQPYLTDLKKHLSDPSNWLKYQMGIHEEAWETQRRAYFDLMYGKLKPRLKDFMRPCVRVLVNKKAPEKLVEPDVVVSTAMKQCGFDVLTDVVEVGEISLASYIAEYRPVTCGVSGGNGSFGGGTLGCIVKRKSDGKSLILSCNHVVAAANCASSHKDTVIQPSHSDQGKVPQNNIGILDDFIPLDFSGGINYVDAALVSIDPSIRVDPSMEGTGFVPKGQIKPKIYLPVKKVGRTTGETHGVVNGVQVGTQGIPTESPKGRQFARFEDLFTVASTFRGLFPPPDFAAVGDSGSLIVEDKKRSCRGVGLLIAISQIKNYTFGCSFAKVSSELGVDL